MRHRVTPTVAGDIRIVLSATFCSDPRISRLKEFARRCQHSAFFRSASAVGLAGKSAFRQASGAICVAPQPPQASSRPTTQINAMALRQECLTIER